jgi:hypothetical protein
MNIIADTGVAAVVAETMTVIGYVLHITSRVILTSTVGCIVKSWKLMYCRLAAQVMGAQARIKIGFTSHMSSLLPGMRLDTGAYLLSRLCSL